MRYSDGELVMTGAGRGTGSDAWVTAYGTVQVRSLNCGAGRAQYVILRNRAVLWHHVLYGSCVHHLRVWHCDGWRADRALGSRTTSHTAPGLRDPWLALRTCRTAAHVPVEPTVTWHMIMCIAS